MTEAGDPRVFVSFAVADGDLANAFVNFLRLGCNLTEDQIFMTARPGTLAPGTQFTDAIREALDEAAMAILLLTPSYYESRFCLAEAGAIWVQQKIHVPLIVPPVNYHDLDGVQLGEQALKINSSSDLDDIRDRIGEALGHQVGTGAWNGHKGDFLNRWTEEFEEAVSRPQSVPAHELAGAVSENVRLTRDLEDLAEENQRLSAYTRDLKSQNDQLRDQVPDAPEPPELSGDEDAQALAEVATTINNAAEKMKLLPNIAREALFQYFHGRNTLTVGGSGDSYSLEDARRYEEKGYLQWVEDVEQEATIRRDQPEVEEAVAALRQVREFVFDGLNYEGEAKAEDWVKPMLKSSYGITDPTFELRPVWEALGFLPVGILERLFG